MPIWVGVIVSGLISLIYIAIGGILADLWTDFIQFIVQVIAGLALFIGVIMKLGDYGLSIFSVFSALPEANVSVFNAGRGQGSLSWTLLYFFVIFFSYSGGTWNLAARFISTSNAKEAKKAGLFSAALYLVWPFILFFPMWCGPLLFPGMDQATAEASLYATLTNTFLPVGMVGLVLASMFANTMTMCNSDANTISAVLTRDILPIFNPKILQASERKSLWYARITTIIFTALTVFVALFSDYFGGVRFDSDLVLRSAGTDGHSPSAGPVPRVQVLRCESRHHLRAGRPGRIRTDQDGLHHGSGHRADCSSGGILRILCGHRLDQQVCPENAGETGSRRPDGKIGQRRIRVKERIPGRNGRGYCELKWI